MNNKPIDKGAKKPYTPGGGGYNGNSGNGNNQMGGNYNNQPYTGYKGQSRGPQNNYSQNQYEKKEYQKKEEGGAIQTDDNQPSQRMGGQRGGGGFKDDNMGAAIRKKGLGKNKFQQIYNEYSHNRKNGIELNQDWLKTLHTQFPQIFVREHLTPIFIDKSYCERFNVSEAFEKVVKKPTTETSNPLTQLIKEIPSISQTYQKPQQVDIDHNSESDEDPQWEVDENEFDFTFKTFDKDKYAQELKNKQKQPQPQARVNVQQKQQPAQQVQSNPLDAFISTNLNQGDELSRFISSIQIGGNNDVLGGLLNGGNNKNEIPKKTENKPDDYELEYEDVDMKLEKLTKQNEKKKEFERQYAGFEEEQKVEEDEEEDDDDRDLEAFGDTSCKPQETLQQARQINLQTVKQNEFDDANDEDDEDEDNDETFNIKPEESFPAQNTNNKQQEQIQLNQGPKASFLATLRQPEDSQNKVDQYKPQENITSNQSRNFQSFDMQQTSQLSGTQKGVSSFGGFGFGNGFDYLNMVQDQDNFAGFSTYGQNLEVAKKDSQQYLKEQMQQELEEQEQEDEDNYSDQGNKGDQGEEQKSQLEELIINNDDVEDIKEKMYEALFQPSSEQERREQEEKRKEKERKKQEKIAEHLSYQEEEKNNFFQAVAYILQANPLEAIWVYKDMKGNKQGPFNSLQMDGWKEHFQNTEVSHHRFIYWIKYKDLTLYTKLYATRVKEMMQSQEQNKNDQQHQQMYLMQQQQSQQSPSAQSSQIGTDINPQIQQQMFNLQMQVMNQQKSQQDKTSQQMNLLKAFSMMPQNLTQQQQQQFMMAIINQNPQLGQQGMNMLLQQGMKNPMWNANQQQQQQQQPQQNQSQQQIQQQLLLLQQQQQQQQATNNRNDMYPNQQYTQQQQDQFNQQKQYQQYMQLQQQQQNYQQQQNDQGQHYSKNQKNKSVTNVNLKNVRNNYNMMDNNNMNNLNQQNHRKNNSMNINQNFKSGNQNYQNQNANYNGGNTNNSNGYRNDYNRSFNQFQSNDFQNTNNRTNVPNNSNNSNNTNNQMYQHRNQQIKNNSSSNNDYQKNTQNRGGNKPYINDQDFPSLS